MSLREDCHDRSATTGTIRRPGRPDPNLTDRAGTVRALAKRWGRFVVVAGVGEFDGVFRLAEWSGRDVLGWSSAELRSAPYVEFVHPDDRDVLTGVADELLAGDYRDRFRPVEVRILARDRHYWWTRWHLWTAADGSVAYATGVDYLGRDGVVGPPMGTWQWNVETDTVVWSADLLDMFALTVGPPMSYEWFLANVHDDDRDDVDRAVRWSLVTGEPYVADFRTAGDADGRDRWFHAAGRSERGAAGRPGHLLGIVKYLNPPTHRPS